MARCHTRPAPRRRLALLLALLLASLKAGQASGSRPSVVKGRETLPALPLRSSGDEAELPPPSVPVQMENLPAANSVRRWISTIPILPDQTIEGQYLS